MMHPKSVTVIGAGLAGLRTVERLRQRGYEGRVVLLGAERHLPYDRPPLSKQVLRGRGRRALAASGRPTTPAWTPTSCWPSGSLSWTRRGG